MVAAKIRPASDRRGFGARKQPDNARATGTSVHVIAQVDQHAALDRAAREVGRDLSMQRYEQRQAPMHVSDSINTCPWRQAGGC